MSFEVVQTTLSAALAASGTVDISYPENTNAGTFYGAVGHQIATGPGDIYTSPDNFTVSFGTDDITITSVDMVLAADTRLYVQLEKRGENDDDPTPDRSIATVHSAALAVINLGAPDTLDADAFVKTTTTAELPTEAGSITYTPDTDGTSPTDGVGNVVTIDGVKYWEMDVPRNIHSVVTHASSVVAMTITVTGLDEYLNTVVEDIAVAATGTTQTDSGVKAFKYVRSIKFTVAADADANVANVGFGDVLGLPVFLPKPGMVLKELQDGAAATAGTLVAGVDTVPTATTGDVRGTYDPNAACDGSKTFELVVALEDPSYKGRSQYAG